MPRPVLLLDVGFEATGVAVAHLLDDGPHVTLSVIVPAASMSTAALNEKRSCVAFGDRFEALYDRLVETMSAAPERPPLVFAELPTMGAMNASGMRAMSLALAAYRAACVVTGARRVDFIRSDVIAAALGSKKVSDETKLQTRALVSRHFIVDETRLPKTKLLKHRRTGAMLPCEATEKLRDNAFDAAAVLFAARNHGRLVIDAGWGNGVPDVARVGG
jgi:hypothetical protein